MDTVENVFVQSPQAGAWTIEVRAAEINQDAHLATPEADAVFALVATGGTSQPAFCGNGVKEGGESCDGLDLGGQTCTSLGFGSGSLTCNTDCTFNTTSCGPLCRPSGQTCTQQPVLLRPVQRRQEQDLPVTPGGKGGWNRRKSVIH